MTAAAVLHRLHDAGVEVVFEAPDQIRLRGPLTDELIRLARAAKPELLALVRPRVQVHACTGCGRFHFAEPAPVCFWCRPRKYPDNNDRNATADTTPAGSVSSVRVFPEPQEKRTCPSCGGGMHQTDEPGSECFSCRRVPDREGGS